MKERCFEAEMFNEMRMQSRDPEWVENFEQRIAFGTIQPKTEVGEGVLVRVEGIFERPEMDCS